MKELQNDDKKFMRRALEEGKIAFEKGEIPIGAILTLDNREIASAHNLIETTNDATAHAEILCIKRGYNILGNWRLIGCTLYVTVEPCIMCTGALILSRIERVVWGCSDPRHGGMGGFVNILERKHPIHELKMDSRLYEEEAKNLMQTFFQNVRKRQND